MNIQFYREGKLIRYSDDSDNPDGITFDGISPVSTDELNNYLTQYEAQLHELTELRKSADDDVANTARKQISRLNWERLEKLDEFCKYVRQETTK